MGQPSRMVRMFVHVLDEVEQLRLLELRHAEELFCLIDNNRAYLRRWLPEWDLPKSLDECKAVIKTGLEQFVNNLGLMTGIWCEGRLAGVVGMGKIDWENRSSNVGYWIAEAFQGRGLVSQACRAIINYAFAELKLKRLEIRCAADNPKSCAIPRRLGFRKEGILRQSQAFDDRYLDIELYGLLVEEWRPEVRKLPTRRSRRRMS
jgi:ribosomal-protein-serine acetyltransferase